MQNKEKQDIYTRITNQIVKHLEQGVRPWVRPWNAEHAAGRITRPLRYNGKPYSGINVLPLWASAKDAELRGSHLDDLQTGRKNLTLISVRAKRVCSLSMRTALRARKPTTKTGDEIDREIPFVKGYTVFNVEQIDGLPERITRRPRCRSTLLPASRTRTISLRPWVLPSGTAATARFTASLPMKIQMPAFESFQDADSYYATLAHEFTHWTGSKSRLSVTSVGIGSGVKVTQSKNW